MIGFFLQGGRQSTARKCQQAGAEQAGGQQLPAECAAVVHAAGPDRGEGNRVD